MTSEEEPMADTDHEERDGMEFLDGNALGGALAALFGGDMTAIPGSCAHCGTVSVIAEMRAYVQAPGRILRCPTCDGVVIRIVETPQATYVDARGAAYLRMARR
jgi:phage FluMu protein Com